MHSSCGKFERLVTADFLTLGPFIVFAVDSFSVSCGLSDGIDLVRALVSL